MIKHPVKFGEQLFSDVKFKRALLPEFLFLNSPNIISLTVKCLPVKNHKTNRELLLLLNQGDRVAFYQIYEQYCKRLYGFVLKYIKQEADAEEVVQEVFIKIWEARTRIDVNASFESFLFTVAYNATMTIFRRRITEHKFVEHLKSIQQSSELPDIIDDIDYARLNEKVYSLLDELTPRQKEIYQLSRQDGMTHEEIARQLDISVNTVKKHLTNSLAFLKTRLDNNLIRNLLFFSLFIS